MSNNIGNEIDLLSKYPKPTRNILKRGQAKTFEQQELARKFDKDFFDGDRNNGYGGYYYNERFWINVVPDFIKFYNLKDGDKILDIGCGKGFMLYDFKKANSNFEVEGIDISEYAIKNSKTEVKDYLKVGDAKTLEYPDKYFDLVISITTVHNLELEDCKKGLKEIERVSKKNKFITVDAYSNEKEKELMYAWNLTAKTILHTEEWKKLFIETRYTGDFYWFKP
jgi:SAM-dependent methyltransferase